MPIVFSGCEQYQKIKKNSEAPCFDNFESSNIEINLHPILVYFVRKSNAAGFILSFFKTRLLDDSRKNQ